MRSLLCATLLASAVASQAPTAAVNDPVSPGTLGDSLLSLDEAIRVVNGMLPVSGLSAGEAARLRGSGVPTDIEIDAAVTPTITLAQAPPALHGPGMVDVALRGVGGRPVLDAGTLPHALDLRSTHVTVANLAIRGGVSGILGDGGMHAMMGRHMMLMGLDISGQTRSGVQLSAQGMMGMTMVMLRDSVLHDLATGIEIDDHSNGGAVMLDAEHVTFDNVQRGVDLFSDATGSMTMCRMWRCKMTSGVQLAQVRRGATSDQRIMLMIVAGKFTCSGDMIDALGTAVVETAIHAHESVFRPGPGRKAFVCGPQNARIDFHISENEVHGDVMVAEGRLNRRLWAWNNLFQDGVFSVSNEGAPTSLRWNRFERCTIRALPTNQAQMIHSSSEFVGCSIDGQSFLGDVFLENCYLSNTTRSGSVTNSSPAPSPWLAKTSASTDTPSLGGHVDLTLDLPPGMLGVWQLGLSDPNVVLTQEPFRSYARQSGPLLLLPGIFAMRTTLRVPVPSDPSLAGIGIYCMPITGPFQGQRHVPLYHLPPGVHLDIQP